MTKRREFIKKAPWEPLPLLLAELVSVQNRTIRYKGQMNVSLWLYVVYAGQGGDMSIPGVV